MKEEAENLEGLFKGSTQCCYASTYNIYMVNSTWVKIKVPHIKYTEVSEVQVKVNYANICV